MTKKRMEEFSVLENHTPYISKNYNRNKTLIDLTQIPPYEESIINNYINSTKLMTVVSY